MFFISIYLLFLLLFRYLLLIIYSQGEDHPCFPDRRTEDRYEGPQGTGKERINLSFI